MHSLTAVKNSMMEETTWKTTLDPEGLCEAVLEKLLKISSICLIKPLIKRYESRWALF